jgi:hypothetical protein
MKYDPQINSLIQEIAGLCYQIKCAQGIDVFFQWSPHIESVSIYSNGGAWTSEKTADDHRYADIDDNQNAIENLKKLRDHLAAIITRDNRPTGQKEE